MSNAQKLNASHFAFLTATGRNSKSIPAIQKEIKALEQLECFMDQTAGFSSNMKKALFGPTGTLEFLRMVVRQAQSQSEVKCKLDSSYIDMSQFEQSIMSNMQSREMDPSEWNPWYGGEVDS